MGPSVETLMSVQFAIIYNSQSKLVGGQVVR